MAVWTNEDFQAVYAFLNEMKDVLANHPDKVPEYAALLLGDCEAAKAALGRIVDAVS